MEIVITNENLKSFIDNKIEMINEQIQKDPELVKLGIIVSKVKDTSIFKQPIFINLYSFEIDKCEIEVDEVGNKIMESNMVGYISPAEYTVLLNMYNTNDISSVYPKIKNIVSKFTPKFKNKEILNTMKEELKYRVREAIKNDEVVVATKGYLGWWYRYEFQIRDNYTRFYPLEVVTTDNEETVIITYGKRTIHSDLMFDPQNDIQHVNKFVAIKDRTFRKEVVNYVNGLEKREDKI